MKITISRVESKNFQLTNSPKYLPNIGDGFSVVEEDGSDSEFHKVISREFIVVNNEIIEVILNVY